MGLTNVGRTADERVDGRIEVNNERSIAIVALVCLSSAIPLYTAELFMSTSCIPDDAIEFSISRK